MSPSTLSSERRSGQRLGLVLGLALIRQDYSLTEMNVRASDLFIIMILAQQSVRTVWDAHGDDAHAADHHHGDVDVGEDRHDGRTDGEGQSAQDVDDLYAEVKIIQVLLQYSYNHKRHTDEELHLNRSDGHISRFRIRTWTDGGSGGVNHQPPAAHLNPFVVVMKGGGVQWGLRGHTSRLSVKTGWQCLELMAVKAHHRPLYA